MKTNYRFSAALTLLLALLAINGCKNDIQSAKSDLDPGSMRTEEIHPLQHLAPELYKPITDEYEDYGKFVYHHFKFNPVDDPMEYIIQEDRAKFAEALEKANRDFNGLTIKDKIIKLKNDGLINDNISTLYTEYFNKLEQQFQSTNSPIDLWKLMRENEQALMARPNDEGVGNLLVASSMTRNLIKYKWEVEEFDKMVNPTNRARVAGTNSFCLFGLTGSCWVSIITQTVFDAAVSAVATGLSNAWNDKAFFNGVQAAGYKGAAVGFIKSSLKAYTSGSCGCGSTTTYTCGTPTGFKLLIDGCELSHIFQVMGGGADATNFNYSVQHGYFPEFGNVSSVSFTGAKSIRVVQSSASQPILLTATVVCSNGTFPSYSNSYDLHAIQRNPDPLYLSGATNINYNDTSHWTYTGSSSSTIANHNNTWTWSRNWAGITTGGGAVNDNYIKIDWIYRTNMGKVYLESRNACSNAVVLKELTVNIY